MFSGVVDPFGKPLPETCPADSADVRERFSLEIVGEMGTPDVVEKLSRGVEFVNEVIEKGEQHFSSPSIIITPYFSKSAGRIYTVNVFLVRSRR